MTAINRFIIPFNQVLDSNGDPIVGAELFFYEVGTTTKKTIYSNNTLTTVAANPIVSDASGYFPEVFTQRSDYKIVLKDNTGVEIMTREPVRFPYQTGITDNSTTSVLELRDDKIIGKVGVTFQYTHQTAIGATLAEHDNEYVPTGVLYGDIANAAYPALEFWHKNASSVFTKSAIGGAQGELYFYTADVFAGSNAPRARVVTIDRNGNIFPEKADGTQDLGSGSKRYNDVFATNGTINTCDEQLKDNIDESPTVDWQLYEAAKPITHTHLNTSNPQTPRRHYSWPARKFMAAVMSKYNTLQNHGMLILTPRENGGDIAGIRPAQMSAWTHLHVLDLKKKIDEQQLEINALKAALKMYKE